MGTFILIVILVGGGGPNTGISVEGIEFNGLADCRTAQEKILNDKYVYHVSAYCVENKERLI